MATLTQRMTMHMNGGDFSVLQYEVLADGNPTGIFISKRTNGRPEYKYTGFIVRCGEEELDVLAAPKGEMTRWIEKRIPAPAPGK